MAQDAQDKIKKVCDKMFAIPANQATCNKFVIDVASVLGYKSLIGRTANDIVDYLNVSWPEVSGKEAAVFASWGHFLIAGLRSWEYKRPQDTDGHGHVAIVVPGDLYLGKYPKVYCGGSVRGQSTGDKSSGQVWKKEDRDQVHYYKAPW
jgi:hypothetical protein